MDSPTRAASPEMSTIRPGATRSRVRTVGGETQSIRVSTGLRTTSWRRRARPIRVLRTVADPVRELPDRFKRGGRYWSAPSGRSGEQRVSVEQRAVG